MITTTLNRIRAHGPCEDRWRWLLAGLGKTKADDQPVPYADILRICGIDDALWACRCEPQYAKEWRLFAVACTRRVQDKALSMRAIDVAEAFAHGEATKEELYKAYCETYDTYVCATYATYTENAYGASVTATYACYTDAAYAAYKVGSITTCYAACAAAEREWQASEFLRIVKGQA